MPSILSKGEGRCRRRTPHGQNDPHGSSPRRPDGPPRRPDRRRRRGGRLLRPRAGSEQPRPAGRVRHLRSPGVQPGHRVQREPHRRDDPGHRGVPRGPGHHRSALHRQGHPRAVAAGLEDRHRGARGQRGHGADRGRGATTPRPRRSPAPSWCTTPAGAAASPRPTASWSPRPTTRPATAASSTTRRTAVPPTPTPPPGSRRGRTSCSPTCPG